MMRLLAILVALTLAAPAAADPPRDQLLAQVAKALPRYGVDVDPRSLNRAQLAQILHIMHSGNSEGDKRGLIRSAVGGRYSLRGLLFD